MSGLWWLIGLLLVVVVVAVVGLVYSRVLVLPRRFDIARSAPELSTIENPAVRIPLETERLKLQNDIRVGLLQAIGGAAVLVGVVLGWQQLQAERDQQQETNRQVAEQIRLTRQGQVAERFGRAIDQLGSDNPAVVLGGIYALEQIFKQSPTDPEVLRVRPEIFEVLTAYIRVNAPWPPKRKDPNPATTPIDQVPELRIRAPAVQAALRVLADRGAVKGEPDLLLEKTDLRKADLQGAFLDGMRLNGANLRSANLTGAFLNNTDLSGAHLDRANLSGAHLRETRGLRSATFHQAVRSQDTEFPDSFDWQAAGIILR